MKQKIDFVASDGGRAESGIVERRDCAVRALAIAAEIPYPAAHAFLKAAGRKNGCGCYFGKVLTSKEGIPGFNAILIPGPFYYSTVGRFARAKFSGRHIIITRNHAIACIDGRLYDSSPRGMKQKIRAIFRLEKIQTPTGGIDERNNLSHLSTEASSV